MQQWVPFILVVAWKMAIVGAKCPPELACPQHAPWCYLIYPTNDGWKYKKPNGVIHDASKKVYESPNCYISLRVDSDKNIRSCVDAQQICKISGGNITVINSIDEYEQLTNNVLHLLRFWDGITFSVRHVQNVSLEGISMGCATITIQDGVITNSINIKNSDNTTTMDTVVCESTYMRPLPATKVMETMSTTKTTSATLVHQTTHPSKKKQSEIKAAPRLSTTVVTSLIVLITVLIILLSFLFIRRRKRRKQSGVSPIPNHHLTCTEPQIAHQEQDRATVSYPEGVVLHEYSTADLNQDQGADAYEILDGIHNDVQSPPEMLVVDTAYAVPCSDVVEKDVTRDQGDMLIDQHLDSIVVKRNNLGAVMYAIPSKNSKGQKEQVKQNIYEVDNILYAEVDAQQASEQRRREPDDAPYENVNAHKIKDTDMHSGEENTGNKYEVPCNAIGDCQQDGTYNMLNIAEVHSKSGKHDMGSDKDSSKLNAGDRMPPKDNMYSYVETSVGGIVSPSEDNAYDKLQRNTELNGALIDDN